MGLIGVHLCQEEEEGQSSSRNHQDHLHNECYAESDAGAGGLVV